MNKKTTEFYEYFVNTCKKEFKFLEKEFSLKYDESIIGHGATVFYKSDKVAVAITLSESYGAILIDLIRLKNKEIPIHPTEIEQDTELNEFDFKNLLNIRNPKLIFERPLIDDLVFNPGREKVVKRVLKQYAEALHIYATDVLNGDFTIFPELEKIVKKRATVFKQRHDT